MREHIVAKAAMLSLRLYGLVIILQVATSWRSGEYTQAPFC
jgi:hypothetical protein